jgi:hypothetical protein
MNTFVATFSNKPFEEIMKNLLPFTDKWWPLVATACTVAIVSFIYKENVAFRIAEHLMIGVAFGYGFVINYFLVGHTRFVIPVFKGGNYWLIIPALLGLMMVLRVVPKLAWVSTFPMAMFVGMAMGMAFPRALQSGVFEQLNGNTKVDFAGYVSKGWLGWAGVDGYLAVVGGAVLIVGTLCALTYFYFSMEHRGFMGGTAKVGIMFLMVGFGAAFGFTVQARVSLFADRVLYILREWLQIIT